MNTVSKLFCALPLVLVSVANAVTITQWTFETSLPALNNSASISGLSAEVGSGTASGLHASADTDWSNPVGNGSNESFSVNTWAIGDYFQFQSSTVGFESISVSWDQTRSSTGPEFFKLAYSTDGVSFFDVAGATWAVVASTGSNIIYGDATTGGAWNGTKVAVNTSYSFNLSSIEDVSDSTNVYFRLLSTSAASGTAGTNRVDNFMISGVAAVPEPSTYAAILGAVALVGVATRRRRA